MGAALLFVAVVFLIWIIRKPGKRTATPAPRPTEHRSIEAVASVSSRDELASQPSKSVHVEDCWIPPGGEVTVAGYTIPGGMFYVGKRLAAINGFGVEPALIAPVRA